MTLLLLAAILVLTGIVSGFLWGWKIGIAAIVTLLAVLMVVK